MQIKPICTAKVLHLAPFLKWEFVELGNGLFIMPRNLDGDWLCVSGPLCHTRVLDIHIRIRQNTHTNPTIGKIIQFVKEALRFVQFVQIVSSSVDWYDHFLSTACCVSLAAPVASRNAQWREVRLHLITGTPNDLMLQNNCYKEQIDTTSKSLKLQKAKNFWKIIKLA